MRGRRTEREAVDRLVAEARNARSGVLVVRGEAGMGKTTLLAHARDAASGFRVLHAAGVEAEIGFAFAGLHQLCAPLLDHLDALPEPQQIALGVALGRRTGDRPDPFLVGLATLSLLAEATGERPLLCLVDDAQWLDEVSLQTLAFVARRLHAEPLALVFGLRDPAPDDGAGRLLAGLPELRLEGLADDDARALLAAAVHEPLDDGVRDAILAEARGNPLALLELGRHAGPTELAGGFGLPDALSVPDGIQESFRRRIATLPAATRLLLVVAAAEPVGDAALFLRAADHLGLGPQDAEPAQAAGLLEIDSRVRFTHPLARSAVYRAAAPADRRLAHGAIAAVTDARTDPDRRTWHQSRSVLGTDDAIAAELQLSADRARARGGLAAAAAFLERSAELTPEPGIRARRMLEAARAKHQAGASDAALRLLAAATRGPLDALHHARAELLRAQIAFYTTRGNDVPGMLLDAAKLLGPLDAALSRETYLHALKAAMLAGPLARGHDVTKVAEAARAAPAPPTPPRPLDLLLDGLVTYFLKGYTESVPELRRAVESFMAPAPPAGDDEPQWEWLASHTAMALWDDTAICTLADRFLRLARESGSLTTLPFALNFSAAVLTQTGELARVADLVDESDMIARATGAAPIPHGRLLLAAWRGHRDEAATLRRMSVEDATRRGEGTALTIADYALAVLNNGLGRYDAALAAAERVRESGELVHAATALPEVVEAAVRADRPGPAAAALEELDAQARATGAPWALGLTARSRALISTGPAAEELYREAIELLARGRAVSHLARAHLVYGEWLRREGRRQDAREQLRTAHTLLSGIGADGFASRAAGELRATGEHPRKRSAQPFDALTAQELRIARLVASGATSKEVAAQLFLSSRTIDAHLRNIFRKLGITSRRQLRDMRLAEAPVTTVRQ
ncbi:AAA family ATPase [Thermomonospora cellulosilytica]|uniref:DNA-binding NarL/FixJ family response regulator n=1 Tax=Thermomonospora cellulosilytica TaxID=1411118 RepID=A0A7W3MW73_9ACTN|nr:AAA family ATPase [Thermomonospora cellulosilytica]MBA9003008.1 DNA-binding NarL/FixJ family response regulator [Thermomonospora cellulosilytica]